MSKLEDKLAASIKTRRPAKSAATRAKESAAPAPSQPPAVAAEVPPGPEAQPLHPRRVWPD